MDTALDVRGLCKSYPGFRLRDVAFNLPAGTIMGLVGPNGAGKTTIIKLILNLVRRQAGEISVFGRDNRREEKAVKARIGFVHETPSFIEDATLKDIGAAVRPFYRDWDEARFRALAAEFELPLASKFKRLSHGMKMKFSLVLALAHDADLLVLDEPTAGLDPVFRRELLERLSGLIGDGRKAVLFSTHITSDLERTADWITFIHDGAVVFSRPKDDIRDHWAVAKGGDELLDPRLRSLFLGVRRSPYGVEALAPDAAAARAALPAGAIFDRASLEDIMIFMEEAGRA